jgi:hypothetical protein
MFVWFALFAFGVLCVAKLFLCIFSDRVWKSVRRYPLLHGVGACLVIAPLLPIWIGYSWPPVWLERSRQREAVNATVQAHGGWDAFRSEASRLIEFSRTNQQFQWHPRLASQSPIHGLPKGFPLLTDLYAHRIEVCDYSRERREQALYVGFYGRHSTGGPGTALYGLLYAPAPFESPDEPHRFSNLTRKQLAPSVYELHR